MVLHAQQRQFFMPKAFYGAIVDIYMGYDYIAAEIFFEGVVVVLGSNVAPPCCIVLYGVIATVMTEFEFIGFSSEGKAEKLMPKANAQYRLFPYKFPDG